MKKILFTSIILFSVCCLADDSIPQALLIESDMHNVVIHQSADIGQVLTDKINDVHREVVTIQGYRVQVFSSNRYQTAKAEAFEMEKRVQQSGLDVTTYVLYNPPFWKVRLGDFKTQEEALMLKDEVVSRLPDLQGDTYVVRDQVEVLK